MHAVLADRTEFWWNKPDERTLWASKIELSEKFFNEIIRHPVPWRCTQARSSTNLRVAKRHR